MTTKSPEEIAMQRKEAMAKMHEATRQRRAEWLTKISALAETLEIPTNINSPVAEGRVFWSGSEEKALLAAIRQLKTKADFLDYSAISNGTKRQIALLMVQAVILRLLPPARQRNIEFMHRLNRGFRASILEIFCLTDNEAEPATETKPATVTDSHQPESPLVKSWTSDEQQNLLIHLAHIMRKQGIRHIPDISDRPGSIMFSDWVRDAQHNALPLHRRIDLTFPRVVMENYGMFLRLEPLLRLPQLPALPKKGPEMDEIIAMQRPKEPERNGNGNGHHPELAAALVLKTEEPQADPFKDFSDAQIFAAALSRGMAAVGKMEAMEKRVEKLAQDADDNLRLLSEENTAITERAQQLAAKVENHDKQLKDAAAETGKIRLPRVAFLGCRKDEFDEIVKRASERGMKCDWRHIEQQGSKVMEVFADYAIMMPGLSHSQCKQVEDAVPRGQYVFMGKFSITKALAYLGAWFQPEVSTAL